MPAGGARLLYDGKSVEPSATHRFRLAVAYVPPESLRLELYPPVGGARLIVIGDGATLVALAPQERRFEILDPGGAGLERLVGVALDARAFVALLLGASPCPGEAGMTAFRPCTTATWHFQEPDFAIPEGRFARFLDLTGREILSVEYLGKKGPTLWPDEIRFRWPDRKAEVDLDLRPGNTGGEGLEPSAFRTEVPPGFVAGPVLEDAAGAPGLLPGSTSSGMDRP